MRPGPGTFALLLHALAWTLYASGLMMGGMDPGPSAFTLVVLAHLTAISGMLLGVLGLLRRRQARRCAFAVGLGLFWIVMITGLWGLFVP